MNLPKHIFFTGVPGSKWSGLGQVIEQLNGFNTSDRTVNRLYTHNGFTGHKGAYFGRLMEFEASLNTQYLDSAWTVQGGTKLVKSHDWAYCLDKIKLLFPDDWIMLVYRPDDISFDWWKQAGGWDISYPSYAAYRNDTTMKQEISWQNQSIIKYADKHNLDWSEFTTEWIENNFGQTITLNNTWPDIKVTMLK